MTTSLQNTIGSYSLLESNLVSREDGLALNSGTVKNLSGFIWEELPQGPEKNESMRAKIVLLLQNIRFSPKVSSPLNPVKYCFSNDMITAVIDGMDLETA